MIRIYCSSLPPSVRKRRARDIHSKSRCPPPLVPAQNGSVGMGPHFRLKKYAIHEGCRWGRRCRLFLLMCSLLSRVTRTWIFSFLRSALAKVPSLPGDIYCITRTDVLKKCGLNESPLSGITSGLDSLKIAGTVDRLPFIAFGRAMDRPNSLVVCWISKALKVSWLTENPLP